MGLFLVLSPFITIVTGSVSDIIIIIIIITITPTATLVLIL
jgi:hypothetical protein